MQIELGVAKNQIPYWSNWFGFWAMNEPEFNALYQQVSKLNVLEHLAAIDKQVIAESDNFEASVIDGVAVLNLSGPMMKHRSSIGGSISTVEARRAVMAFDRDPTVKGLVLKMETPGGTVAGTMELAKEIADFSKPTMGFANDLVASAGYFTMSQCDTIAANQMAMVGSIGTLAKLEDSSKAAEDAGVKVHVIKAGDFKGAGMPGTEITEEHLAETQRIVNAMNESMLALVAEGRNMPESRVRELADGRVHMAAEAKQLGLIDSVSTFDQAFNQFHDSLGDYPMSSETQATEQPKPISAAEIRETFPRAGAEWRLKCLEGGLTHAECVSSYADLQEARAEAAEQKLAAAQKPGVEPVATASASSDDSYDGDAISAWNDAVASAMKATGGNRARALSIANRNNPGLRDAMLQQRNAIHGRKR